MVNSVGNLALYFPIDKWRAEVDEARCRVRTYDNLRVDVVGHQCRYKPTTEREGVPICTRHSKIYDKWNEWNERARCATLGSNGTEGGDDRRNGVQSTKAGG
jgi:hypothetical protein